MKQARQALRLYRHFLGRPEGAEESVPKSQASRNAQAWTELADGVRRVMRLQHESLSTEKTYLMWLGRSASFADGKSPEEARDDDATSRSRIAIHCLWDVAGERG